jgi:hypothetical protein
VGGQRVLVNRLVAGSCLALILGALVGMPVLLRTVTFGEQPRLSADVVYAYFSLLPSNQSVLGLQHEESFSFLFVLNVTNLSNELVEITSAEAIAAGEISFIEGNSSNQTVTNYWEPSVEWSNATQVRYGNLSFQAGPIIAKRSESFEGSRYWWPENGSKLLALSGMVESTGMGLDAIRAGKIYVLSHVEGKAYSSGVAASGAYVIKGVQLEAFGDSEFAFNDLLKLGENLQIQSDGTLMISGPSGTYQP